jgi:hypothetical protein
MIPSDHNPTQYTRQNHAHWQHQRPACTTQNLEAQEPSWLGGLRFETYTSTSRRADIFSWVLGPAVLQICSKFRYGTCALGRNRRQPAKPFGRAKLQHIKN